MKIVILLAVCVIVTASPSAYETHAISDLNNINGEISNERNIMLDALIRQLFQFIIRIINNGWPAFGIPVLDPLDIEEYHLQLPAGIINLDLELEKVHATGLGQFNVHKSVFNTREISFDVDISFPQVNISAEKYDLKGDFFTAIPLYGMGKANFLVNQFNFKVKLYLMQSEDGKSILIKNIENGVFIIPNVQSNLSGVIGGGDIDKIVNVMIEEIIFDYVNRFNGVISELTSRLLVTVLNPFLAELDTWKYIQNFLPRT